MVKYHIPLNDSNGIIKIMKKRVIFKFTDIPNADVREKLVPDHKKVVPLNHQFVL